MLRKKHQKEVIPAMMEKFGYANPMAVPKIEKVVLNVGFGKKLQDKTKTEKEKIYQSIMESLAQITGQRPILCRARKSISGFKVKKGDILGTKVTLRRKRMMDFLERLIHIALPRSRDFEGIPLKSFDREGNLTIGMKEHIAFPEISAEREKEIFPLGITITTTTKSKEEGIELLRLLGFPLRHE